MIRAKEYLLQLKKLNCLIHNKMIEKRQWFEIATGISPNMGGERVQSSGSQQKMANAMNRYIDIEKEIDATIDKLVDAKRDVISVIEQLDATEYDLLHKIYVQGRELQDVADDYSKSYSWVTTVHGQALKSVQSILDERGKDDLR